MYSFGQASSPYSHPDRPQPIRAPHSKPVINKNTLRPPSALVYARDARPPMAIVTFYGRLHWLPSVGADGGDGRGLCGRARGCTRSVRCASCWRPLEAKDEGVRRDGAGGAIAPRFYSSSPIVCSGCAQHANPAATAVCAHRGLPSSLHTPRTTPACTFMTNASCATFTHPVLS